MPQFQLNTESLTQSRVTAFDTLDSFERGYVEAMFFTNGDTGDEREHYLNDLGVSRLTKGSIANIKRDCATFRQRAADYLTRAYSRDYDEEQAGRDFWFTRQGHGVGFWDRDELNAESLGQVLSAVAKTLGEMYVETWRGWIHCH